MDRVVQYKDVLISQLIENNESFPCEKDKLSSYIFFSPPSLRLTFDGFKFLRNLYEHYTFPIIGKDMTCKQWYNMEALFTAPYYRTESKVCLFSKKDTFIVRLHGNDVSCYLDKGFESGT